MKKTSIIKRNILYLVVLALVIFFGVTTISGIMFYNVIVETNSDLTHSFLSIATQQVSGDTIEAMITNSDRVSRAYADLYAAPTEGGESASIAPDETDHELIRKWEDIDLFLLHTISFNPDLKTFQIFYPDGDDAVCIWLEQKDSKNKFSPMTRRKLLPEEKEAISDLNAADENYEADLTVDRVDGQVVGTSILPIRNNNKKVVAYAQLDISLTSIRTSILILSVSIGILILLILAAAMVIYHLLLEKRILRPILKLEQAADGIVEKLKSGDKTEALDIHTCDEIGSLARSFENMEDNLRGYIDENAAITAEREQVNAALNLAAVIQNDMLPAKFPPFPDRSEFEIYASMTPAKEVGGDFYDFFMIDDDTLALVIADVSGKGIPAALFMMRSMLMIEYLTSGTRSPSAILGSVNNRICDNNDSGMFVTIWLGILDINTGILRAASAGHEYPIIKMPGGSFEIYKDPHSFIVGGTKNIKYKEYELNLPPGTTLFLYTDGVPEANNSDNRMFGLQATVDALNRTDCETPDKLIEAVNQSVNDFVQDAEQFDDLTMLCFRYNGCSSGIRTSVVFDKEITVDASKDNVTSVKAFIGDALSSSGCPGTVINKLELAVEELFINIADYSYETSVNDNAGNSKCDRPVYIRLRITKDPSEAVITLSDRGIPFDPLAKKDPDVTLDINKRRSKGLGIFLSKQMSDAIKYEYKDGQNIIMISKKFDHTG